MSWTREDLAECSRRIIEDGESLRGVARSLGVRSSSLHRAMAREGLPTCRPRTRSRHTTIAELRPVAIAIEYGAMSLRAAADMLDIPTGTLRHRLVTLGLYAPTTTPEHLRAIAGQVRAGRRLRDVCAKEGLAYPVVQARMRALGLVTVRRQSLAELRAIAARIEAGEQARALAAEAGVAEATLHDRLRTSGLKRRTP